ncbi:unnamed protein product [Cercospora beticola]|nr:unnamed protein product [Cercospora beticola]
MILNQDGNPMALPPYEYEKLPDKRSIRVLTLHPGLKFLPLKISLSVISLDDLQYPYEAISYVWGDATIKSPIACDGKKLVITKNLKEALEQFRDEDHPRVLWADALCINQTDLDERASQVMLMWDVYSQASQCLVWLGKPTADIRDARNLLTDLIHEIRKGFRSEEPEGEKLGSTAKLPKDGDFRHLIKHQGIIGGLLPPLESPEWQPLIDIFDLPYFSRIWVIQEINACSSATVFIGPHSFSWPDLVLAAQWIGTEYDTNRKLHIQRLARTKGWWTAGNMSSVFRRYTKEEDVAKILEAFHMCEATDSRDMIFALLGFGVVRRGLGEGVVVDYKVPVEELYAQVARIVLGRSEGLEILSYHWHGRTAERANWTGTNLAAFPSWLPRWNEPPDQDVLLLGPLKDFNASGAVARELVIEGNTLRVSGHIFDTVRDGSKIKWVDVSRNASRYVTLMAPMFAWPFNISEGGYTDLPSAEAIINSIFAITAGLNENHNRAMDGYLERGFNSWYNTLYAFGYNLFSLKGHMQFKSVPTPEWEEYQRSAYAVTKGRAILRTQSGRIGIGPYGTHEGDLVCALYGGDVLYVLRPIEDYFVLIGEAYFYGAMDGEVVSDDQKWPRRDFEIH